MIPGKCLTHVYTHVYMHVYTQVRVCSKCNTFINKCLELSADLFPTDVWRRGEGAGSDLTPV